MVSERQTTAWIILLLLTFGFELHGLESRYKCKDDEFDCGEGQCILASWTCDGFSDCKLGRDELNCASPRDCLSLRQFKCYKSWSEECIRAEAVCDGRRDCYPHREDEDPRRCAVKRAPKCEGQFKCKSNECINLDKLCDGYVDCADGSDEIIGFCLPNCPPNNKCDQLCWLVNGTETCQCQAGFQLSASDNKTCQDINECQSSSQLCSQYCINEIGHYNCTCAQGYQLIDDGRHCSGIGTYEAQLVFAINLDIKVIGLQTNHVASYRLQYPSLLKNPTSVPWTLSFDAKNMIAYWASRNGSLYMTNINTARQQELWKDLQEPNFLNYDWIGGNIYLITQYNQITICRRNITTCSTLSIQFEAHITSLVIAPTNFTMFWSAVEIGESGAKIWRSKMDASDQQAIAYGTDIRNPESLTIDLPSSRIYWIDRRSSGVYSSHFDGSDLRREKFSDSLRLLVWKIHHHRQMDIFEHRLFILTTHGYQIVDRITNTVEFYQVLNREAVEIQDKSILIVHEALQPTTSHGCINLNQCQHICVPMSSQSHKCLCSNGYISQDDGRTCIPTWISNETSNILRPAQKTVAPYPSSIDSAIAKLINSPTDFPKSIDSSPTSVEIAALVLLSLALITIIVFVTFQIRWRTGVSHSLEAQNMASSGEAFANRPISYSPMNEVSLD